VLAAAARRDAGLPASGDGAARLVLIVDQFEQVFTLNADLGGETARQAFITALCSAAATPAGPGQGPAALVVLAVRWLDSASAEALVFTARRLGTEGVGMVFTLRRTGPWPAHFEALPAMGLEGLDAAAAAALVSRERVGPVPADLTMRLWAGRLLLTEADSVEGLNAALAAQMRVEAAPAIGLAGRVQEELAVAIDAHRAAAGAPPQQMYRLTCPSRAPGGGPPPARSLAGARVVPDNRPISRPVQSPRRPPPAPIGS